MLADCIVGRGDHFPEETSTAGQIIQIANFYIMLHHQKYTVGPTHALS